MTSQDGETADASTPWDSKGSNSLSLLGAFRRNLWPATPSPSPRWGGDIDLPFAARYTENISFMMLPLCNEMVAPMNRTRMNANAQARLRKALFVFDSEAFVPLFLNEPEPYSASFLPVAGAPKPPGATATCPTWAPPCMAKENASRSPTVGRVFNCSKALRMVLEVSWMHQRSQV